MSNYNAICNVNKTLVNLLWNSIKDDAQVNSIISTENQISLSHPKAFETETSKKLSLFLYQITEFSSMRNQPTPKRDPNQTKPTPVYLALHYLITPYTQNTESDHIILGKILQIFADNAILRGSLLQGSLSENGTDIRVVLEPLPIDDLNKLWNIFGTHYRLSVSYSVAPIIIGLTPRKEIPKVLEEEARYKLVTR
jgi:hypothetical protein